jgi:TM2 domain-containing membrane protein YozV
MENKTKFCSNCGVQIPFKFDICPSCGSRQAPILDNSVLSYVSVKTKYCVNCGAKIDYKAEICIKCGVRQPMSQESIVAYKIGRKNPTLAAVLSVLIIGLGHVYVGKILRGIGMFFFSLIIAFVFAISFGEGGLWVIAVVLWVFSGYDAHAQAKRYNLLYERNGVPPW